jgi:hypothetical protein
MATKWMAWDILKNKIQYRVAKVAVLFGLTAKAC